jgi:hypothetical protein
MVILLGWLNRQDAKSAKARLSFSASCFGFHAFFLGVLAVV